MDDLYFRQILMGPMANFVYMIGSKSLRQIYVVDPAWNVEGLIDLANQEEMEITGILVSHTHPDHVGGSLMGNEIVGVAELLEHCKAKVYVHKSEAPYFSIPDSELVKTDGQTKLTLGEVEIEMVHTPGHTPGSQCFKLKDRLISGDTLFIGSCGRTDLPGSSPEEMYDSLTQKLMKMEDDTIVFPGHNYAPDDSQTTIGKEKSTNPFFQFPSKTAFLQAMGFG